ncbi:hypothetical protein [Nocardioides sp. AE5]|uniref:hypothetical protein n=1 Tax=Nocardioides sp. AE5 TaxID=2962573 RepID=UPI002880DBAB|nr:hypothetical protein [Nocardioides sp. AE5]MDT0201093.1 hypothetical protein [Nocardioides sp. AE5]
MQSSARLGVLIVFLLAPLVSSCGSEDGAVAVMGPAASAPSSSSPAGEAPTPTQPTDADRAESLAAATSGAETLFSYDWQSSQTQAATVQSLLTDSYYAEWEEIWESILPEITAQKARTTTTVVDAGLVGIAEDAATVVLFMDQTTEPDGAEPKVVTSSIVTGLVRVDGDWLIDSMATEGETAPQEDEGDPERAAAMDAAAEIAVVFTNIDHRTVDDDMSRLLALTTGAFREEYEGSLDDVKAAVVEAETVQISEVSVVGLATFEPNRALAVVVASGKITNTAIPDGSPRNYRMQVALVFKDGMWLAEQITLT